MGKIISFDLDDTLCIRPPDKVAGPEKYEACTPIIDRINLVNRLWRDGNKIIIFTSRGMSFYSGNVPVINRKIKPLTIRQLAEWGVKYDELIMGKPHYDVFIDDKALNANNPYLNISIDNLLNKKIKK